MSKKKKQKTKEYRFDLAQPEDLEDLVDMIMESHKDQIFTNIAETNEEAVRKWMGSILGCGSVVLARNGGPKPVGMCAFVLFPLFWNPTKQVIQTMSWWVRKEARGQGLGTQLLKEAERVAKGLGGDLLFVTVRSDMQQAARSCVENGFKLAESHYVKGL